MNRMGLCAFCVGLLVALTLGQPLNEPEWEVDRLTSNRIDAFGMRELEKMANSIQPLVSLLTRARAHVLVSRISARFELSPATKSSLDAFFLEDFTRHPAEERRLELITGPRVSREFYRDWKRLTLSARQYRLASGITADENLRSLGGYFLPQISFRDGELDEQALSRRLERVLTLDGRQQAALDAFLRTSGPALSERIRQHVKKLNGDAETEPSQSFLGDLAPDRPL